MHYRGRTEILLSEEVRFRKAHLEVLNVYRHISTNVMYITNFFFKLELLFRLDSSITIAITELLKSNLE